jgi:hypothetical protein
VTVCKVRLASSLADKVVILVDDIWEGEFGFQLDEDIPF